jgi:hypothetical protein
MMIYVRVDDGDLFNTGRICDYCGANQDAKEIESLKILHYRLDSKSICITFGSRH